MKTADPSRKLRGCLDRPDAATYLSISTRLLDQLAGAGQIPRIKIGRKTLFRVSDLDDFVKRQVQKPSLEG